MHAQRQHPLYLRLKRDLIKKGLRLSSSLLKDMSLTGLKRDLIKKGLRPNCAASAAVIACV
ncbi:protein of unknown function [Methylocaldum szegediense]|uniref:Uncharacterized protein n=1 Tax=Methylocaldum szegediense TaxID=73780 RepID=A0ABM9HYL3_9GAMM|nr:protein of unknown function [Methylocaldum szegediense]